MEKNRHSCRILTICAALLFPLLVMAQTTVNGTIVDPSGEPIIGASVVVKGTTNGTVSDFDGNFTLSCPASATLVVSYVGYKTQELAAQANLHITLEEDVETLQDVVVIGYGSLAKKELSSSVVQVNRDQFNQGAVSDAMGLVSGKIAGLNVNTTADANPNSMASIQVRGATSITASNGPLVVIDGIAGGDLRNIASQDVESITVLKDAASAAIYGTRGANGVILVTTKKGSGEEGKVVVTYDSYAGMNIANQGPQVLSADEFRRSRRGNDYGYSTDWYSLITRKIGYTTNQYVSVDASTKNGYYGASINWKKGNGLDLRSGRDEYGGRFRMEQNFLERRLQLAASLSARKVHEEWGNDGLFDTALSMNPTMPVKNEDGSYYQPTSPTGATNPVRELLEITNNGDRVYLLGNADLKWNILSIEGHNLSTSVSYAMQYNDLKSNYYTPSFSADSYWNSYAGRANVNYQKWNTNRVEWLGNYQMSLGEHDLKAVIGYSWERSTWEQVGAENANFAYDNFLYHNIGSGSYLADGKANMWTGKSESTLIGFFGRVNYNWRDMLFASASIRYEGSSKFGADHRWGAFPSASLAWEMMSAEFMAPAKNATLKSLKPRISYGVTGRSDFDAYQSTAQYVNWGYYYFNGQWVTGFGPSVNSNPQLGWEKSTALNIGFDFELLNGDLRGSLEYFDRQSQDLLYRYTAPQPPFIHNTILVNVGSTTNKGVEVSLEYDVFKKTPVTWTTSINYSYGTTYLSKLSNDVYQASFIELYQKPGVGTSEYFFRIQENGKVGQFWGYEYAGSENGNMLIYDNDGNKIPVSLADASYKRYIGNGAPEHFLNWNNTITWNNFDLSLMFRGVFGFDIFNMRKYGMGLAGSGSANVLRDAYLADKNIQTGGGVISSFFLEKGDFFKLDNITLGYTFMPKERKLLESLRVYINAKNIFTLTGYKGNDPSTVSITGITPSVDVSSSYPTATQLSLGLTIKLH